MDRYLKYGLPCSIFVRVPDNLETLMSISNCFPSLAISLIVLDAMAVKEGVNHSRTLTLINGKCFQI